MNYTGQAEGQHAVLLINESSDQVKISYFLYYKCVQTFPHMDLQKVSSDWPWIKEEEKQRSSASLSTEVQVLLGRSISSQHHFCAALSGLYPLQEKPQGSDPASSMLPR